MNENEMICEEIDLFFQNNNVMSIEDYDNILLRVETEMKDNAELRAFKNKLNKGV